MTGIPCPQCQATESEVLRTLAGDGRIVRRRKCKVCGHRVNTVERLLGDNRDRNATGIGLAIADLLHSAAVLHETYLTTGSNMDNS